METLLVRLKPHDPRRGHVLRRYTYRGLKFHVERGWYRVEKEVGEYLRTVHAIPADPYTPLAFDVATDAEAQGLDVAEAEAVKVKRHATDALPTMTARPPGVVTTEELPRPSAPPPPAAEERDVRRARRERD